MDIQKRIVFTVELEFTFPSLVPEAAASCLYHAFFFRPLPLFRAARFVPEGSSLGFIPVPLRAARPYATHTLVRCSPEAEVIRLQIPAFSPSAQKKRLRHAAIEQQNTLPFQLLPAKQNLVPQVAVPAHVPPRA